MASFVLHFIAGSVGCLGVFLICARLSGTERFSAPFGLIFIGVTCASLAHYLSPWATPAIVAGYAVLNGIELWQDRRHGRSKT